jgi:hypothetical protein
METLSGRLTSAPGAMESCAPMSPPVVQPAAKAGESAASTIRIRWKAGKAALAIN